MSMGTLTFFCGKMGAGKSTKANAVAHETKSILISEDEWLMALYPNRIASVADYVKYSDLLKPPIKKLTESLLLNGQDVVLDFPANTIQQRRWLRDISDEIGAPHRLYYIDVSDEVCLRQIAKRREERPNRENTDTEEMFRRMTGYFNPPRPEEELNIIYP